MILVTVGQVHGFQRLVDWMDEIAAHGGEEVVMQVGDTPRLPRHARSLVSAPHEEMLGLVRQSRLVVAHAGAGTVLTALQERRPVVLVPRLRSLGEHIDDHQLELAEALAAQGKAIVAHSLDELRTALAGEPKLAPPGEVSPLVGALRRRIAEIAAARARA